MNCNKAGLICSLVSFLIYINTFQADFVYDDRRAIVQNPDVTLRTPWSSLLFRDYWGTSLNHSGSHGSYRPLTVLTFRLNYLFFGLEPWAYHVTNVLLHCITTYVFCIVLKKLIKMSSKNIYFAGLLFALHPIHTEAVAGVVGRADILATLFCLLTLLSYSKSIEDVRPAYPKSQLSNDLSGNSRSQIQTLTHKNRKSVRKKYRSKQQKQEKSKLKCENHIPVTFDDVMHYKSSLNFKAFDAGTVSDDSNETSDTYDSLASSTATFNTQSCEKKLKDVDVVKQASELVCEKFHSQSRKFLLQNICQSLAVENQRTRPFKAANRDSHIGFFSLKLRALQDKHRKHLWLMLSCFTSICALLSKENGYCALPICVGCDLLTQQLLDNILSPIKYIQNSKSTRLRKRICIALTFWIGMMAFRVGLPLSLSKNGDAFPKFSPSDNPTAACSNFFTRAMTFNYLVACNIQMLLIPVSLSFDWSMDSIPLISSTTDMRNFVTLAMYLSAIMALKLTYVSVKWRHRGQSASYPESLSEFDDQKEEFKSMNRKLSDASSEELLFDLPLDDNGNIITAKKSLMKPKQRVWKIKRGISDLVDTVSASNLPAPEKVLFGVSVIILSLLPATNLLFYVGFVLAERLLYLPSIGSCVLIVELSEILAEKLLQKVKPFEKDDTVYSRKLKRNGKMPPNFTHQVSSFLLSRWWLVILLGYFGAKTMTRNLDWKNEMSLYRSGLAINPAKSLANLGNSLRSQNQIKEAELAYKNALKQRPNMADTHYNLGLLYQQTGRHKMAEESYRRAIQFRPGLAVAHLNLGVVLMEQQKREEAKMVYKHAARLENLETKDPTTHANAQISSLFNLGCMLADEGDYKGAVAVFNEAVLRPMDSYQPHSLYNMLGQSLFYLNRFNEAEKWFKSSLVSNSEHVPAHLAYARLLAKLGNKKKAEELYDRALHLQPENTEVYKHYSNFLNDLGHHYKASQLLTQAAEAEFGKNDYEIIFSAASAYRQAKHYSEAEKYYKRAVELKPKLAAAYLNLGAIYHLQEKYDLAKISYHRALDMQPDSKIILQNLSKLHSAELKLHENQPEKS